MTISVVSVGTQQLVASQSQSPSDQTSSETSNDDTSTTVSEPSQSQSANNNNSGNQSGSNSGSGGASSSATTSTTETSGAAQATETQGSTTASSTAIASPVATTPTVADLIISAATPKSQVDAKVYDQTLEEQFARDSALAQQERARSEAILEQLKGGPQGVTNLFDDTTDEQAVQPIEVAVPDEIPDRLPPSV